MDIALYACGTYVTTALSQHKGMITAQSIRFGKVSYEVTYYDDGKHETVWMNECEFRPHEGSKKESIGYKTTKHE